MDGLWISDYLFYFLLDIYNESMIFPDFFKVRWFKACHVYFLTTSSFSVCESACYKRVRFRLLLQVARLRLPIRRRLLPLFAVYL